MTIIATLETLSNALDTAARFIRVMSGVGVTLDQLMLPVNNRGARTNLAAYLAAGCPKVSAAEPTTMVEKKSTLILVSTTQQGEVAGGSTSNCFTCGLWGCRDADIDRWLPAVQPAQEAGKVGVYEWRNKKGIAFREMTLAATAAAPNTTLDRLEGLVKERGLTFTLPAIENLVKQQEAGEDVGLRADGYANFFLIEDASGSVSVLYVNCRDDRWNANVYRLDNDIRWRVESRLLLRNSDAQIL